MRFNHANAEGFYTDLAIPFNANSLYYKSIRGGAVANSGWVRVLDALNYNTYSPDSLSYISETIKSASLQIEITPYSGCGSPYISNLKICYGNI